ncbi:MAG: hypothetical protein ABSE71_02355 [Candidatus Micrarchaeaceae archaeon]|jgi:hypothetical protein|nr:hypothetical protein [Candidatus Micrarchaeota archaeon]HII10121.1 hypothetical protein [Candidatus Micrarchaeota archaeon]
MAKTYKVSSGDEYVIVTVDDGGSYIIKDMAGRKVFLSKHQAELMKFGINNIIKGAFKKGDDKSIKIEEIKQ